MKRSLSILFLFVLFFSCKKENSLPIDSVADKDVLFFQKVKSQLKDSLSSNDYTKMDSSRMYKSKDAQSKGFFVRIGLLTKNIATDFILLKTDTLGTIRHGKIVHVDKEMLKGNNKRFGGRFAIASLTRSNTRLKAIVSGKFKSIGSGTDLMEAEASVGEQTLPDCVITCYSNEGSDEGDWYWYEGFYDECSGGGGGGYTYGYSGGGSAGNSDNTMVVKIEPDNADPIKVEDYIKCFSIVPDANASYKISIFSDIPVNGDPSKIFDWSTNSPGHSFIQLNKSGGGQSIQQSFGFYPEHGWKSASNLNVGSKIVDNAGHEFNASLSLTVNGNQFQAALNEIQAISGYDYNITSWNCTDFALSVFNAASPQPLTIPKFAIPTSEYPMPTTVAFSNTPEGLYEEIQSLQSLYNTTYGTTEIPGIVGYVGGSHGSCN